MCECWFAVKNKTCYEIVRWRVEKVWKQPALDWNLRSVTPALLASSFVSLSLFPCLQSGCDVYVQDCVKAQ